MADSQDAKTDFNAIELSVQAHGQGISSLGDRVTALEQNFKDPKILAKTLEEAAEESTRLKKLFSKIFCDMMKDDDAVKTSIKDRMETIDRDQVNAQLKKIGGKAIAVIWTVVTIALGAWLDHKFGK